MSNSVKTIISSLFLVGNGVMQKAVGLLSTLVLARILVPADFAVVAIAMLVVAFTEVFAATGSAQYIVSRQQVNTNMLNSAWTLDLSIKLSICVIINLVAYPTSVFYGNPELQWILHALSFLPIFSGLSNPGIWLLQREQNYRKIVTSQILSKIISVILTVSIAIIYESYWALVVGNLTSSLCMSALSYKIHTHRPTLRVSEIRSQIPFSMFMLPQELFGYVKANVDSFLISKNYSNEVFGNFHVMKYLAVIPSLSLLQPIARPLLVEMARDLEDRNQAVFKYCLTFLILFFLSAPVSIFLYLHSYEIVLVVLGKKWLEYHEILALMGLLVTSFAIANHCKHIFMVLTKTQYVFIYEMITVAAVVSAVLLNLNNDIIVLIAERVAVELVTASIFLLLTTMYHLKDKSLYFLKLLLPGILVCAATFFITDMLHSLIDNIEVSFISKVLMKFAIFFMVYSILLLLSAMRFYRFTREGIYIIKLLRLEKLFAVK